MKRKNDFFDIEALVKSRRADAVVLLAGVVLGVFLDWTMIEIAIFMFFIWSIVGPIPSRFLAVPALFFLSFTPILLLLGREDRAEEFAVYAYYFLVMAVIQGIVEVRSEKRQ